MHRRDLASQLQQVQAGLTLQGGQVPSTRQEGGNCTCAEWSLSIKVFGYLHSCSGRRPSACGVAIILGHDVVVCVHSGVGA